MQTKKFFQCFAILLILLFSFSGCNSNTTNENSLAIPSQESIVTSETTESTNCRDCPEKNVVLGIADYPYYETLNDLILHSDYIIRGNVIKKGFEWRSLRISDEKTSKEMNSDGSCDDGLSLITIFDVEVLDSYTEAVHPGDLIYVMALGGETSDTIYKILGDPDIQTNTEYVLFLSKSMIQENGGWLMNDSQSLYVIDGENIKSVSDAGFDISFDNLKEISRK